MKKVAIAILVLVLLVVIAAGVIWAMLDSIVRTGIEKGGSHVLGVNTTVDALNLSLINGHLTIDGLTINNPEGLQAPYLMKSGHFELQLEPASLLTETISLQKFEISGLTIVIEQQLSGNNISAILANLKRFKSNEKTDKKEKQPGGKKLKIDRVLINNIEAQLKLAPELGIISVKKIKIPRIELTRVTSDNANGILISELFSRLFPLIVAEVLNHGEGIIPDNLFKDLKVDVTDVAQLLGEGGTKLFQQIGGDIGKLVQQDSRETVEKIKETLGKTIDKDAVKDIDKGVGDKLKGLFPGKKKSAPSIP